MNDAEAAHKRVLSTLGLAAKAGGVASGAFAARQAVKDGTASLVIVATDASENTKKLFRDKCSFYKVPLVFFSTREALGRSIGKEERACVALTKEGMAKTIKQKLEDTTIRSNDGGIIHGKNESA